MSVWYLLTPRRWAKSVELVHLWSVSHSIPEFLEYFLMWQNVENSYSRKQNSPLSQIVKYHWLQASIFLPLPGVKITLLIVTMSLEMEEIRVIELHMMDKRRYFPLTLVSGMFVRSSLYPFMLIKTRLQIQRGNTVYKGTFDALFKIGATEGVSGLYRGFWVSC